MFERNVVLMSLASFTGVILAIFGTISLMKQGVISSDSLSYLIPIEMLLSAALSWTLIGKYQRGKIFRPLIEDELRKHGYELISERPLHLDEIIGSLHFAPTILINGMPIQSYTHKARNERMLQVRTSEGVELLVHAVITKTWRNKVKLEITKKVRLD